MAQSVSAERINGEAPAEVPIETPPARPTSQLERLKQRRRKLAEERRPLDLAIPGWEDIEGWGTLVGRYRVLDYEELEQLKKRGMKMARTQDPETELKITIDTIAAACVGIFCRQENGTMKPLNETDPAFGDEPVRYDERLADAIGADAEGKVRTLIRQMFPTELSIFGHLERIDGWMSGINQGDDEDF